MYPIINAYTISSGQTRSIRIILFKSAIKGVDPDLELPIVTSGGICYDVKVTILLSVLASISWLFYKNM